jgi:SAM-dependent methyltransferase
MNPEIAVSDILRIDPHEAYLRARAREGRLLTDGVVAALPDVPPGDPLRGEWRMRADSSSRLLAYLRSRRRALTVVDLGCGNGWLSNRIAAIDGCNVLGLDVNAVEIAQARRVFRGRANLRFAEHDILEDRVPVGDADVVVLASVIQYVPQPAALVERLLDAMHARGEVHVLDSPLYELGEVAAARTRTRRHYEAVGVPEMANAYHHHAWTAFGSLTMEVLYRPDAALRRIERRWLHLARSPFPWLRFVRRVATR